MLILATAMLGALTTFYLTNTKKVDLIRSSSGASLVFYLAALCLCGTSNANFYGAIFFGGSFVGMSASARLSIAGVAGASALFAGLFVTLLPLLEGIGGALGACAFVCVSIVISMTHSARYLLKRD